MFQQDAAVRVAEEEMALEDTAAALHSVAEAIPRA